MDRFAAAFTATFGGAAGSPRSPAVTPTPSSTKMGGDPDAGGHVSVFGFTTPVPFPFGDERTGYLVTDMDRGHPGRTRGRRRRPRSRPSRTRSAQDAVVQWPGGVNMQLYWHTTPPNYAALQTIPENRSTSHRSRRRLRSRFLAFSRGKVVSDDTAAPGVEIGRPGQTFARSASSRPSARSRCSSPTAIPPYPYGRETTGYEVTISLKRWPRHRAAAVTMLGGAPQLPGSARRHRAVPRAATSPRSMPPPGASRSCAMGHWLYAGKRTLPGGARSRPRVSWRRRPSPPSTLDRNFDEHRAYHRMLLRLRPRHR